MKRFTMQADLEIEKQKPSRWILAGFFDRRMFRGDITFLLAAVLPIIRFAFLDEVPVLIFFEFVAYEFTLVLATGLGSKHYRQKYIMRERVYYYGPHTPQRILFGIAAVLPVYAPLLIEITLLVWGIAILLSVVVNLVRGEGKNFWLETLTEFTTSIRAGYLIYLAILGILYLTGQFTHVTIK